MSQLQELRQSIIKAAVLKQASADQVPLYHYCSKCKEPACGARSRNAKQVYDVKPEHCLKCTPDAKRDIFQLYPCVVSRSEYETLQGRCSSSESES